MATSIKWMSPVPTKCQLCNRPITNAFFDARVGSTWAYVGPCCEKSRGIRTGIGLGQRYERQVNGDWTKTAG